MSAAFILACSLSWTTANVAVLPHLAPAESVAAVASCERTFVSEQECQRAQRAVVRVFDQHLSHLSADCLLARPEEGEWSNEGPPERSMGGAGDEIDEERTSPCQGFILLVYREDKLVCGH